VGQSGQGCERSGGAGGEQRGDALRGGALVHPPDGFRQRTAGLVAAVELHEGQGEQQFVDRRLVGSGAVADGGAQDQGSVAGVADAQQVGPCRRSSESCW
jgi:hypothetical protein